MRRPSYVEGFTSGLDYAFKKTTFPMFEVLTARTISITSSSSEVVLFLFCTSIPESLQFVYFLWCCCQPCTTSAFFSQKPISGVVFCWAITSNMADSFLRDFFWYVFLNSLWELTKRPPLRYCTAPTRVKASTKGSMKSYFLVPMSEAWHLSKTTQPTVLNYTIWDPSAKCCFRPISITGRIKKVL